MKQFSSIFKFELMNYLRNKVFLVLTVVFIVVIGVMLSFPRLAEVFGSDGGEAETVKPSLALIDLSGGDPEGTLSYFNAGSSDFAFSLFDGDEDALKEAVKEGQFAGAVVLRGPLEYSYIVNNLNMYDTTTVYLNELLLAKYRFDAMQSAGMPAEEAQSVLNAVVKNEVVQTGKNQMESFFYTYILMFLLYMAIVLYGQLVATSVASEKSSRAMELLITSAKPTKLMFGKVLGAGSAGLLQMALLLGSGFVFFNLNRSYWAGNEIISSMFDMPLSILLYTLLFFILGFFLYAFLYGALGSLANRSEDVNTLVMPVTFLFIIAFFVVMYSMASGSVDTPLITVCSFIPFTSPMAMFIRIAMGTVAGWEIALSVAILVLTTIAVGYLSAAIYRIGVLLYGKPPKLSEVFRMLRRERN